jgi:hypothetical protein
VKFIGPSLRTRRFIRDAISGKVAKAGQGINPRITQPAAMKTKSSDENFEGLSPIRS